MKIAGKNLRVVILRRVYDLVDDPTVQMLFSKLIALKVSGYRREYPYGILPIDTTDYFADHLTLCEDSKAGLIPMMSYKTYTLQTCDDFQLSFPLLDYVRKNASPAHFEALSAIVNRCVTQKKSLSYHGSVTISNEAKTNPELRQISKNVLRAIFPLFSTYLEPADEALSFGAVRFKVDQLIEFWGFKRIALDGTMLPDLNLPSHFGAQAAMLHLQGPASRESLEFSRQFQSLWDNKIVMGDPSRVRTEDIKTPVAA